MSTTYNLCKKLIELNRVKGLQEKLDMFYTVGRLTDEEYKELTEKLKTK